jgi:pimeloyl-ACP methyl ester carboxylesterase
MGCLGAKLGWQPRWFNPDLEKWLHRIKLPALVVWGDGDKIMLPANAALWRDRLPNARLVIIEDCGHLPHAEKAALVARHVREFLDGVAP